MSNKMSVGEHKPAYRKCAVDDAYCRALRITLHKRRCGELRCIVTATVKEAVANAEIPKEKEIAKARARSTRS